MLKKNLKFFVCYKFQCLLEILQIVLENYFRLFFFNFAGFS